MMVTPHCSMMQCTLEILELSLNYALIRSEWQFSLNFTLRIEALLAPIGVD